MSRSLLFYKRNAHRSLFVATNRCYPSRSSFLFAKSSFSEAVEVSSELDLWYKAVADVPLHRILPIGLGNTNEIANVNAFFGVIRMNLEISKVLRKRLSNSVNASSNDASSLPSLGDATTLQSLAISNQLLSQCLSRVLPHHMNADLEAVIQENAQINDAATMMEAAVDAVASLHPPETADAAISALARYLVQNAVALQAQAPEFLETATTDDTRISSTSSDGVDMINPKGQLLQVGGTVESSRLEGYPDHAPQFTATARFEDLTATVNFGRSKREAEQSAASMIWRYYAKVLATMDRTSTALPHVVYDEEIDNPKGRILSIGGVVTSEILPEYPDHFQRYRAKCSKSFFVTQPATSDDEDDAPPEKSCYTLSATAEGRTQYEAERIASTIVWRHVMNMPTTPNVSNTNPMLSVDVALDPNAEEEEDAPEKPPVYMSAKQKRYLRNLKKYEKRKINEYVVRDGQLNFLHYKLEEQPIINLRPGGETVLESWYRGALNPAAAFHRALIAPHVFPNHIATVNAYTRHNLIYPDDDDGTDNSRLDENVADEKKRTDFATAENGWKSVIEEEEEDEKDMAECDVDSFEDKDISDTVPMTSPTNNENPTENDESLQSALVTSEPSIDDESTAFISEDVCFTASTDNSDKVNSESDHNEAENNESLQSATATSETTFSSEDADFNASTDNTDKVNSEAENNESLQSATVTSEPSMDDDSTTFSSEDVGFSASTNDNDNSESDHDEDSMADGKDMEDTSNDDGQWEFVSARKESKSNLASDDQFEFVSDRRNGTDNNRDSNDQWDFVSNKKRDSSDSYDDEEYPSDSEQSSRRETKWKSNPIKTYSALVVVLPNLNHPLVKELGNKYNSSEVLAKCFVEHGRTPREARTAAGLAVNRYIIDVLLKNYEYLLEGEKPTKSDNDKTSYLQTLSKVERKNMFFKF